MSRRMLDLITAVVREIEERRVDGCLNGLETYNLNDALQVEIV